MPISALENADQPSKINANAIQDFSSKRLIVSIAEDLIREQDKEFVISSYQPEGIDVPTFLIQYENEVECQRAYVYYISRSEFVDVDIDLFSTQQDDEPMTPEENPLTELSILTDQTAEVQLIDGQKVLAIIDTGVGTAESYDTEHVIRRVTVLSNSQNTDGWDDHGHGSSMLRYAIEEDPNIKVLSIKALGSNGSGQLSSIYSGMVYAIEQGADVISLSLAARVAVSEAPAQSFQQVVNLAAEKGITVVASSGNYSSQAKDYIPCALDNIVCVGAAKVNGERQGFSNHGEPVAYTVIANSTSEASARTAAVIYKNGASYPLSVLNQGKFFEDDYVPSDTIEDFTVTLVPVGTELEGHSLSDFNNALSYVEQNSGTTKTISINLTKENINNYDSTKKYSIVDVTPSSSTFHDNFSKNIQTDSATVYLDNLSSNVVLNVKLKVEPDYQFECWDGSFAEDESKCPAQPTSHTITVIGGGTPSVSSAPAGTIVTVALNDYDRNEKKFLNWRVNSGNVSLSNTQRTIITFEMPDSDVEIEAVFTSGPSLPSCAVSPAYPAPLIDAIIVDENGNNISDEPISNLSGSLDIVPVEKEGFKFVRWNVEYSEPNISFNIISLDSTGKARITYECATINKIEAIYEPAPVTPVVTYHGLKINHVVSEDPERMLKYQAWSGLASGSTVEIASEDFDGEYEFDHWVIVSGDAQIDNLESGQTSFEMPAEDVELKAVYKKVIKEFYNIDVSQSSVELNAPATAAPGSQVTITPVYPDDLVINQATILDGCQWTWSPAGLNIDQKDCEKFVFTMPEADVRILFSIQTHEEEDPEISYQLSTINSKFTSDTSSTPKTSDQLKEGVSVVVVADDAPEGYEFDSWEISSDFTGVSTSADGKTLTFAMPAKALIVTAKYKQIDTPPVSACPTSPYGVELVNAKMFVESNETSFINPDKTMTLIANEPEKESMQFSHWEILAHGSSPDSRITYSNTSTTELKVECMEVVKIEAHYKETPPAPEAFECWDGSFAEDESKCPARQKYTITVSNGLSSETEAYEGQLIRIEYHASSSLYKFNGWTTNDVEFEDPSQETQEFTMPAHNVTIVGNEIYQKPPVLKKEFKVIMVDEFAKINDKQEDTLVYTVYGPTTTWPEAELTIDLSLLPNSNFKSWIIEEENARLSKVDDNTYRIETELAEIHIKAHLEEIPLPGPATSEQFTRKLLVLDPITNLVLETKECTGFKHTIGNEESVYSKCETAAAFKGVTGYKFIRWELVSGNGNIANPTSQSTSVELLSDEVKIRAVVEAVSSGGNNSGNGNSGNNNSGNNSGNNGNNNNTSGQSGNTNNNSNNNSSSNPLTSTSGVTVTAQNQKTTVNTGFGSDVIIFSSILLMTVVSIFLTINFKKKYQN